MRDRRNEAIPDSAEDTLRDFDGPTQVWSGQLSLSSLTPRLRAARRRQRLEALLNTQTGITFEAVPKTPDVRSDHRAAEKPGRHSRRNTSAPGADATKSKALSGPQLALFVALGVAVGGIAALQLDRVLQPTSDRSHDTARDLLTQPLVTQPPALAVAMRELPVNESSNQVEAPPIQVAVPPAQSARSLSPKPRAQTTYAAAPLPPSTRGAVPPAMTDPATPQNGNDLRIPTQLHPRINPLMTSNQVFRDE